MQTIGNVNNIEESATTTWSINPNPRHFSSNRIVLSTFALLSSMLMTGNVCADSANPTVAHPQLDNTERNARDSGNATLLPEDQKETSGDIDLTAAIRRTVVRNKSLSLDAHNAKIITRNGVVTLRGPVENPAEKAKLQKIAQKTKGVKQVDNQLEVKTP